MKGAKLLVLTLVVASTLLTSTLAFAESSNSTQPQSGLNQKKVGGHFQRGGNQNGLNSKARANGLNQRVQKPADKMRGRNMPAFGQKNTKNLTQPGINVKGAKQPGRMGFGKNMDPTTMIENQKANIQKRVEAKKITQTEADTMIAKINQKLLDVQTFNAMTPQAKKDKLLADFTSRINRGISKNKMSQDKVDKAIADYKAKLDKWDGTGAMPFSGRGFGHKN